MDDPREPVALAQPDLNDDSAWHAIEEREVATRLASGPDGLGEREAGERLARFGPNAIEDEPPPGALTTALHQFRSPLIVVLLIAAAISVAIQEWLDAGIILAILVLNAAIGFAQERHAERSVRALASLVAPVARVLRGGNEIEVPSVQLVPGDLVLLESGSRVPADLRLATTTALAIDESLLTGESIPVRKGAAPLPRDTSVADRVNMAFTGTIVTSGRGRGFVVATGIASELGTIAARVRAEPRPETPLQARMDRFARVIGVVVIASAFVAFAIGIATGEPAGEMFLVAVALAVSAIPEGLPIAFTITLARGVRQMARHNAIVRHLPAVETLGSTTVIGSDKTGTLTENRMTVQTIWSGGTFLDVAPGDVPDQQSAVRETLICGVLTNEASLAARDGDYHGDPTEVALLVAAGRLGVDPAATRESWEVLAEAPFEPDRQFSSAIRRMDGRARLWVKGAPERVLTMCGDLLLPDGSRRLLDASQREEIHAALREMAGHGLRVLAMASGDAPTALDRDALEEPAGLTFLGMQGMIDPPRAGVPEAIVACRTAGIRVMMITGDHAATAHAIGRQIGLDADAGAVLTGEDVQALDDDALLAVAPDIAIVARAAPEDKLRVVHALRRHGEVVAVTGDGVNDAPALHAAEIGIAMGRSGTDVAREAADMVLADDNFVSIRHAVEAGRVTFDNIRKASFFLLSSNTAEVLTILAALSLGWELPLIVAQILWLNLVTDGLQNVALAFEPGENGVLERPPRGRGEGILSATLWERLAVSGIVMTAGTLTLFHWELNHGASLAYAQTVALTTLVLFQTVQAGNARSEHVSLLRISPLSNRFLFLSAIAAAAVHIAALYLPPTQYVLRVEPLALASWLRIAAVALTLFVAVELHKAIRRPRGWGVAPLAGMAENARKVEASHD